VKITVRLEDFARVFESRESARIQRVRAAVHEAALLGAEIEARAAPVDVGALKSSIRATRESATKSVVIASAPHAAIVERGSRPHVPPLQPLIDWVRRHVKTLRIRRARDRRGRFTAASEQQIENVARAIQRKIMFHGTRPTWFIRNTLPRQRRALERIVRRALRDPRPRP